MSVNVSTYPPNASLSSPRALKELPGPRPWPILGNLPQIDLPRMHRQLESWAAVYGPTYRIRLGVRDALVVSRSETITSILRDRPDGWRRLESMKSVLQEMGSHGLFTAEGDDWRRQRRLVMSAFDPGHLKRYFESLAKVTDRLRHRLEQATESGESIDLLTMLMRYTVDVTAGLAFGIDMNTQQHPDHPLQRHLAAMLPMVMRRINAPFPWWRHVRLPSDRLFDQHLAHVHSTVRGFVKAAREKMRQHPHLREQPENLLQALIAARDEAGAGLDDEALLGNVLTVLVAGEDTTANTIAWCLYLLHNNRPAWDE